MGARDGPEVLSRGDDEERREERGARPCWKSAPSSQPFRAHQMELLSSVFGAHPNAIVAWANPADRSHGGLCRGQMREDIMRPTGAGEPGSEITGACGVQI